MLPIQGNSRCIGHFSGPTIFSAAKLVRFWLIQEFYIVIFPSSVTGMVQNAKMTRA